MKRTSLWMRSPVFAIVLATILGLGLACARKPDDAKISSDIQSKFSQDSGLSTKQLTVQASDGVVTLAGNVDNDAQREAASRQAASVPGVRTVVNNLQVGTAPAAAPQPAAMQASSSPPTGSSPAAKAKPGAGKTSRVQDPGDSDSDRNSKVKKPVQKPVADSNAGPMTAGNQPPPPATAQNDPSAAAPSSPPDNPGDTPAAAPTPPPPAPRKLIIDEGTQLTVRLIDPIDSEKNQTGDTFHATLNAPLSSDGEEAVPAGTELTGHLVDVKSAGKFAGQSEVVLQLDSISSGGQTYALQTDQYKKTGSARGKNTAEKVGGGAVLGGIIGALAGGGKGAAIGAAAGAGAGGAVQGVSKSQQIKLASETVLNFTLQAPITVVQTTNPDANRQKLSDSQPQ
jgi:hypothetical protein